MAPRITYKMKRFNMLSPNFNAFVLEEVEKWAFDVENAIKMRLNSGGKPAPESRNLLRSIRHDIKGGIKKRTIKTPEGFKNKNEKVDTIILRMKAGSGESIQDRGSPGDPFYAPQALLLELGGVVTPKTTKKLWIPLDDSNRGMGKMLQASGLYKRIGNLIIRFEGDAPFGNVIAILKSVQYIPPYPYMRPTIISKLPELRTRLKAVIAEDIETK